MASNIGQQKEGSVCTSDNDEGSSRNKAQIFFKARKFDNTDQKEGTRLRSLSRKSSHQRCMTKIQSRRFHRIIFMESDSDNEEQEDEGISLAAIKAKYKALVKGKRPKHAKKEEAQRPRKILIVISDAEEEQTTFLKRKAEAANSPTKKLKKSVIRDDEYGFADEG